MERSMCCTKKEPHKQRLPWLDPVFVVLCCLLNFGNINGPIFSVSFSYLASVAMTLVSYDFVWTCPLCLNLTLFSLQDVILYKFVGILNVLQAHLNPLSGKKKSKVIYYNKFVIYNDIPRIYVFDITL